MFPAAFEYAPPPRWTRRARSEMGARFFATQLEIAVARSFPQDGLMLKPGVAVVAGGVAFSMALQSALVVAAAPRQHSTLPLPPAIKRSVSAPETTAMHPSVSRGRLFGKFVSTTARTFPAGPQHGKVVSEFARTANPGHTRHATSPGHSVKPRR